MPHARRVIRCLALVVALPVSSSFATIQSVELGYNAFYRQTGPTSVPALQNYTFHSRLITDNDEDLFLAFVRPSSPAGAPQRSLDDLDGGLTYQYISGFYTSETAMRTDFPAATYTFSISGGTLGALNSNFNGPSTLLWPVVIPRFFSGTYNAFASFNSYRPFTFNFNSMSPPAGATSSNTTLTIADTTGFVVLDVTLPSSATEYSIPEGFLEPDNQYLITVRYNIFVNFSNTAFSAAGLHAFTRSTSADIITGPLCFADFDFSGTLTPQDIFDYLNAWFANSSSANVDGVPGITPQDIFFFLNAWFVGHC